MKFAAFEKSLKNASPPAEFSDALKALWYEKKGGWEKAHEYAQEDDSKAGSWVHAYLHRKEGDVSNARYWYSIAGEKFPSVSLDAEWEAMVRVFLRGMDE